MLRAWSAPWSNPIREYLKRTSVRRLHLGCGEHLLPGWLNCDRRLLVTGVVHLDVREPFPINDDQFDYVFSEHMIEHLTFEQGAQMLAECHRVLRPGGRIRVSTPDLAFVVGLYTSGRTEVQQRYIEWAVSSSSKAQSRPPRDAAGATLPAEVFVINSLMRDWGHKFIYDEQSLRYAMHQARFRHVVRRRIGESAHEALRNLENRTRLPAGFLELETFTLEAEK
jgi:predicted SAM-dependent methyltransferase